MAIRNPTGNPDATSCHQVKVEVEMVSLTSQQLILCAPRSHLVLEGKCFTLKLQLGTQNCMVERLKNFVKRFRFFQIQSCRSCNWRGFQEFFAGGSIHKSASLVAFSYFCTLNKVVFCCVGLSFLSQDGTWAQTTVWQINIISKPEWRAILGWIPLQTHHLGWPSGGLVVIICPD